MADQNLNVIDLEYTKKQVIKDELRDLPEEYTVLVVLTQKNYEPVLNAFMIILLNDMKLFGTYITTNRPFRKVLEKFLAKGVKADNLFFVDCVTKDISQDSLNSSGIKVFASENVNDINIVLDRAIKSRQQGGQFIFLDSVSTLLVYNDEKTVEKFVHSLLERIYRWRTKGIFITVETQANKMAIENLSLFFDKTIRIME